MSIRIIPQDELGSSEKRTADMIPPLLFPRLKNLYNRRAERLRDYILVLTAIIKPLHK